MNLNNCRTYNNQHPTFQGPQTTGTGGLEPAACCQTGQVENFLVNSKCSNQNSSSTGRNMIEHVMVHTQTVFGACTESRFRFRFFWNSKFHPGVFIPQNLSATLYHRHPTSNINQQWSIVTHQQKHLISPSSSFSSSSSSSTRSNNMSTGGVQLANEPLYMPILSSTKCNRRCLRYSLTKDLSSAIRPGCSAIKTYCWWKRSG